MRRPISPSILLAAGLTGMVLGACDSPAATPADAQPPSGPVTAYVATTIRIPTTTSERVQVAQDIDGDPNHRLDNVLADVLDLLSREGMGDLQAEVTAGIAAGKLLSLHEVQANDLVDAPIAWWTVSSGADLENPDLSGSGSFTLDPAAPPGAPFEGKIEGGVFTGGPGRARLELVFLGAPLIFDLVGARVEASVSVDGCSGKLGGGVSPQAVTSQLIPALAARLTEILHADPACPAACTGPALRLQKLFDFDVDNEVTIAELDDNALVTGILAPDLDLFDANRNFNPRQDGVKDSLSLGVGFTCARATIVPAP